MRNEERLETVQLTTGPTGPSPPHAGSKAPHAWVGHALEHRSPGRGCTVRHIVMPLQGTARAARKPAQHPERDHLLPALYPEVVQPS